ncbi:SMP-30/gluconolactonase/LRE family protein [Curtobacterium sp. MCPF17_011]|uniref:SMP-30/gluconolactonase/LRE family protein n=1 Tax=unclassified Curtobacterium TaxID=257496 RepID=UPI000D8E6D86|nr:MULTISPECIES: SMP-30/gluconolactonase/LRE family protein [unclassified Curtobacterium]PYY31767.1 SMP-30/gluconolactonase/LRE family protein [Curtobacterium sp. MCBD17_030]PZF12081.1 SMP-30/gluconolactonase/LRE family protein [Curtobacterium sp. MCPF17_011]
MTTSATAGPATVFSDVQVTLAESIVWDPDQGVARWADIPNGTLMTADADGRVLRTAELGPPLASFQPRAGGGFVAAQDDTVVLTDDEGHVERQLASVEHANQEMRFNEGKCDPFGRFLVGSMDPTDGPPAGVLYAFSPDGSVRVLRTGFGTTNGMEWNDDGSEMYVTDTDTETIYRGSYGPDGVLGDLVPFIQGSAHDGLVRDDAGCFWGAIYGESRVERYGPDGTHLETVEIPAPNVTSVAFGGTDMSLLLVGTARENMTEEQLARAPHSGSVFAVPTSVHGRPAFPFGG